jgi:hypothetical protein
MKSILRQCRRSSAARATGGPVFGYKKRMRLHLLTILAPLLLVTQVLAQPGGCASSIPEVKALLGDPDFPLRWEETSMDDGKPLLVSIVQSPDGTVHLEFVKTRVGLWAESSGVICRADQGFEIRFSAAQIRFGPAASWLLRLALGRGGRFTLNQSGPAQLQIATTGWAGTFVPRVQP